MAGNHRQDDCIGRPGDGRREPHRAGLSLLSVERPDATGGWAAGGAGGARGGRGPSPAPKARCPHPRRGPPRRRGRAPRVRGERPRAERPPPGGPRAGFLWEERPRHSTRQVPVSPRGRPRRAGRVDTDGDAARGPRGHRGAAGARRFQRRHTRCRGRVSLVEAKPGARSCQERSFRRARRVAGEVHRQAYARHPRVSGDAEMTVRAIFSLAFISAAVWAQQGLNPAKLLEPPTDAWPMYHGDYTGRRYSTLTKINSANIGALSFAWIYRVSGAGGSIKSTPLQVNGVLYFASPDHVWAVDA